MQNPVEMVAEVPEQKTIKVPKVRQIVADTLGQNQVQTIEVEKPKIAQQTVQRQKSLLQDSIIW